MLGGMDANDSTIKQTTYRGVVVAGIMMDISRSVRQAILGRLQGE